MPEPEAAPALPADIAALSPVQARSEIDRIRGAAPSHPWKSAAHPDHAAAQTRMDNLYRRLGAGEFANPAPAPARPPAGEPGADPAPAAEDATAAESEPEAAADAPVETVMAADLPPGYAWDEPTLNALGELATAEEIDPTLLREGTALVSRLLAERAPVLSGEEAEAVLARRWGSRYEYQIARATETWNLLPKRVQADLTKSGIRYHPEFAEFLLKVGDHRWDATTDAGLARIKAKWEAKQAAGESA